MTERLQGIKHDRLGGKLGRVGPRLSSLRLGGTWGGIVPPAQVLPAKPGVVSRADEQNSNLTALVSGLNFG